jgi:hypothetical protein
VNRQKEGKVKNDDKSEPIRLVVPLRPDVFKELQEARKLLNFGNVSRLASEILRVWLNNDFGCSLLPDKPDSLGRSDDKVHVQSLPKDQQRNPPPVLIDDTATCGGCGQRLSRALVFPCGGCTACTTWEGNCRGCDLADGMACERWTAQEVYQFRNPKPDDTPTVRCTHCGAPTVDNDRWNLTGLCPACKLCNVCNNVVVTDDTAMPCGRCIDCATDAACAGCPSQGTCPVFEDLVQVEGD